MAHRQEEKEQRRAERMAREEAARKAAARKKRLQYVFGGVLAVAIVGGHRGRRDARPRRGRRRPRRSPRASATWPATSRSPSRRRATSRPRPRRRAATLDNPEIEGSTHETKNFKAGDFKTNPPTSGNHNPDWYQDGIYAPGDTPRLGMLVHTLEHGRIDVQYKKGTSEADVAKLEALLGESDGYHMLLFENTTGWTRAVAATALGPLGHLPDDERRACSTRSGPSGPKLHRQGPRGRPLGAPDGVGGAGASPVGRLVVRLALRLALGRHAVLVALHLGGDPRRRPSRARSAISRAAGRAEATPRSNVSIEMRVRRVRTSSRRSAPS